MLVATYTSTPEGKCSFHATRLTTREVSNTTEENKNTEEEPPQSATAFWAHPFYLGSTFPLPHLTPTSRRAYSAALHSTSQENPITGIAKINTEHFPGTHSPLPCDVSESREHIHRWDLAWMYNPVLLF